MRTLLFTLLFSLLAVPAFAQDWAEVVKKIEKALVFVETEDGGCTGFVVDTARKYVLTAAHCDGKQILVDRVPGKLISKDTKKDLLILEVEYLDPSRTALKLATAEPQIGQEVMSAGYGYTLERPFFRKAMVSDNRVMIPAGNIGGPYIGVDSGWIEGQSGGPVVNESGEVVSIVQLASDKLGIGVSASIIRERMGRFLATK